LKQLIAIGLMITTLSACNLLKPEANPAISFYALNRLPMAPASGVAARATIIVNPPHAAAGFETSKIIYLRQPHQMEYYSQSEWVATPAKMLSPLIVDTLSREGSFIAVVLTPTAALADLRLTTEVTRLQHEFFDHARPSRVRFTLRAIIMDEKSRKVLVARELEAIADSPSENAAGAVAAANLAVALVLKDLAMLAASVAQSNHLK
jgi:cholesterol transport system auxiliary component